MLQYQAFDPSTEISGQSVLAAAHNTRYANVAAILERRGLAQVDPNGWYRVQQVLDMLGDVFGNNAAANYISIGMAIAEFSLTMLPTPLSFADFLDSYSHYYRSVHRNGDAGEVCSQHVDDNHILMILRVPYPDDIHYGMFYAFARHLLPAGTRFSLRYDTQHPRRDHGGEATLIHIVIDGG